MYYRYRNRLQTNSNVKEGFARSNQGGISCGVYIAVGVGILILIIIILFMYREKMKTFEF